MSLIDTLDMFGNLKEIYLLLSPEWEAVTIFANDESPRKAYRRYKKSVEGKYDVKYGSCANWDTGEVTVYRRKRNGG